MSAGSEYDTTTAIGTVRRLIGDRAAPFHYTDSEITEFLTQANSCSYGAAGLALMAWAAEAALDWESVSTGSINRQRVSLSHMRDLAKQYIDMSDEVSLKSEDDVSFGTARVDWKLEYTEDAQKLREFAED